jgi:integrase
VARPNHQVQIFSIQERRAHSKARPWVVRWRVEGRDRSRSYRTRSEADRYRSQLLRAVDAGETFDLDTGEPTTWQPSAGDLSVYAWAQRWLAEQWPEWQPRTRSSAVEALTRLIPLASAHTAPAPPPTLRRHLFGNLPPEPDPSKLDAEAEMWLHRWSIGLVDLDKALLAEVDHRLAIGDNGQQLSAWTAARNRKIARACIRRAVDLDILAADPWPPPSQGRSRRKALRRPKSIDIRALPDPATMARAIAAVPSHQPSSRTYQAMIAVSYYAGLRPSEVVMLRPRALYLPTDGWGRIDVVEADIDFDVPGEPKTGTRSVPIPPVLVAMLRQWLDTHSFGPDDLIFRTRTGRRPTPSNWARTWQRALRSIDHPSLRVYDCRHAAATTWLQAGVPLGEVARRLGHSVETLVSTYVGALTGDESLANQRIDLVLARSVDPSDVPTSDASLRPCAVLAASAPQTDDGQAAHQQRFTEPRDTSSPGAA